MNKYIVLNNLSYVILAAAELLLPETRGDYKSCPERTPGQGYSPASLQLFQGLRCIPFAPSAPSGLQAL